MTAKQATITIALLDYCLFGCKYNWETVSGNGIKCADFEGFNLRRVDHFWAHGTSEGNFVRGLYGYK